MILKSYWGAAELSLTWIGHAANAAKLGAESRPCFFDSREMPRVSALHSLLKPTRSAPLRSYPSGDTISV